MSCLSSPFGADMGLILLVDALFEHSAMMVDHSAMMDD
jgi:hypothetical protein